MLHGTTDVMKKLDAMSGLSPEAREAIKGTYNDAINNATPNKG